MEIKTADLIDEFEEKVQVLEPVFKDYGGTDSFYGKAVCVRVFEDNVLVRRTLETKGDNCVLVVDGGGSVKCALVGDILSQLAIDNQWAGLIVHGAIRDSKEIAEMPIGLKALNTSPRKSRKEGVGATGEPLQFAGGIIHPGNYIYADPDGILVAANDLLHPQ